MNLLLLLVHDVPGLSPFASPMHVRDVIGMFSVAGVPSVV